MRTNCVTGSDPSALRSPMIDFDCLSAEQLADALRRALARGLPGRIAQRAMTPELAYGRHHGPVPAAARRAAVLLAANPGRAARVEGA